MAGSLPRIDLLHPPVPGVDIAQYGDQQAERRWHGRELVNPVWRFYAVDRPGLVLVHAGREQPYPPDRITVIPAWCRFRFLVQRPVRHTYIHCTVEGLPDPLVRLHLPAPLFLDDRGLVGRFRGFAELIRSEPGSFAAGLSAGALARDALVAVLATLSPQSRSALLASNDDDRLGDALGLVQRRLAEPIGVADLAGAMGVSRAQCHRIFQRVVGTSPAIYIQERRIERAARLLATTDLTLGTIARDCGLGNRSYLSRVFTRRCGLAPSAYRELRQAGRGGA
jgi:AraC-like DNA-binding protein